MPILQTGWQILMIFVFCSVLCIVVMFVKTLDKYLKNSESRKKKEIVKQSLGEVIRKHRNNCKMTQEFVAEYLGVSRQAVSKWENGKSDPSTSNLIAIAKLFGITGEEILREVEDKYTM